MSTALRGQPASNGSVAGGPPTAGDGGTRLRLYRNPLRLAVSPSLWRAAWFLAVYVFAVGWLMFAVALTATVTAAVLLITLAGIPLLVAAAAVLRWCADVERGRLRQVLAGPVRAGYRPASGGLLVEARARWQDPATWRDVAYLVGLWAPLFVLDTIVLSVWLTFLAGVTLPAWFWAPHGNAGIGYTSPTTIHGVALGYFPHGPHGPGGVGLYVDSLPTALLAAAGFLALFLIFSYAVLATARAHAAVARTLLRAPADPLAPAKEVLAGPGPLGPLHDRRPPASAHPPDRTQP
jgi:Putative sensor